MKFLETDNGLYIWKPSDGTNLNKKQASLYSFFTLVEANKTNFTRREVDRADECKKLYINLGMPGYKRFFAMLDGGKMRNCHLTTDDAKHYLFIYRPELIKLK